MKKIVYDPPKVFCFDLMTEEILCESSSGDMKIVNVGENDFSSWTFEDYE